MKKRPVVIIKQLCSQCKNLTWQVVTFTGRLRCLGCLAKSKSPITQEEVIERIHTASRAHPGDALEPNHFTPEESQEAWQKG